MLSTKMKKSIVKLAIGSLFSTAIGYAIKLEKKIEDRIDESSED